MRAFYRRPIAFASFLAVLTGLVSYQLNARIKLWFVLIFVALSLLALVPVLLRRGGKRVIELLICLVAISVSFVSSYLFFDVRYQSYQNLAEQTVEVEGTVLERRSTTTFMTTFRVSLDRINGDDVSADAIIECNYQSAMQVGDTFSIKGTVRDFEKSELFDEEQFYISDGCLLIVTCDTYYDCEIGEPNHSSLRVIASKINASISNRLSVRMGREEGSLAAALLLGNRSLISPATKLDFQYAGVSHLLALSGLHVSIMIAFVEFALRSLWIGKRGRAIIVPLIAVGYLILTGFAPSTCRAVMMAIIMYVALLFGERYDSFTALMLVLSLTLMITPYAILDLSLWMSYISAAAIVLIYPLVLRSFDGWYQKKQPPILVFRTLRAVVGAIVIGVAANLALILLNAFVFGTFSLSSVPTTLVLSIPITLLLVLSLLTVLFPFLGFLPSLCEWVASLVLAVTDFSASVEGVLLPLNDAWSIGVLAVMTVAMILFATLRLRRFVWLLVLPILLSVALCTSGYVTKNDFSDLHLTKFETGYGNLYLYTQSGYAVLVNDARGAVAKDYEIKRAAIAQRCTVIDELVICRYYNQATYFIGSLSESIYVRQLHLPTPIDAREEAIAKRIAEEAQYYGIEVLFDADEVLVSYAVENGDG